MGQAKQRGTYQERQDLARARALVLDVERRLEAAALEKYLKERAAAQAESEKPKPLASSV